LGVCVKPCRVFRLVCGVPLPSYRIALKVSLVKLNRMFAKKYYLLIRLVGFTR